MLLETAQPTHQLLSRNPNPVFPVIEKVLNLLRRADLGVYERERYRSELAKLVDTFSCAPLKDN